MAEGKDKQIRKAALDKWKAEHRASARSKLPLPDQKMQALFDMLDTEWPKQACDHSLRLTHAWLKENGLDIGAVEAWLHENGANCDCEALANAEQAWQDAIHDVNW